MMSRKFQSCFAGTIALFGVMALAGGVYLGLVFPKMHAVWAQQERALSAFGQVIVKLSYLCTHFGYFLIPILLLGTIVCGARAAAAVVGSKREAANN
jgi:type II secretory pathway component PulF